MQIKRSIGSFTAIHSPFSTGIENTLETFGFLVTICHGCPYKSDYVATC